MFINSFKHFICDITWIRKRRHRGKTVVLYNFASLPVEGLCARVHLSYVVIPLAVLVIFTISTSCCLGR